MSEAENGIRVINGISSENTYLTLLVDKVSELKLSVRPFLEVDLERSRSGEAIPGSYVRNLILKVHLQKDTNDFVTNAVSKSSTQYFGAPDSLNVKAEGRYSTGMVRIPYAYASSSEKASWDGFQQAATLLVEEILQRGKDSGATQVVQKRDAVRWITKVLKEDIKTEGDVEEVPAFKIRWDV
jgi:hypothetical protein